MWCMDSFRHSTKYRCQVRVLRPKGHCFENPPVTDCSFLILSFRMRRRFGDSEFSEGGWLSALNENINVLETAASVSCVSRFAQHDCLVRKGGQTTLSMLFPKPSGI